MDHAPTRDAYYTADILDDSPLRDDERDDLRDAIRHAVLGIKENIELTDFSFAPLEVIVVDSFRDENTLSLTVYLDRTELDVTPETNETYSEGSNVTRTPEDEVHYLRDLGHTYDALEYDLLSELVLMLNLPEVTHELKDYLLSGDRHPPCLYGTSKDEHTARFAVTAHITDLTQRIYDDAEFELARRVNIPIEE